MKSSPCLALLALLPLGCGGATPAPTDANAVVTSQRPAEVTVVDLSPAAPPAPKEQKPVKAAEGEPGTEQETAQFGMIGLLGAGAGGDPNAPTSPWGKEERAAIDNASILGNMRGDQIGDSFGVGGLGLAGTGIGGGGTGSAIGLGSIGTLGHGTGQGFGSGGGSGAPRSRPPQVKMGAVTVSAGLLPEIIQRIVRRNYGRFRLCYENGLRSNPKLAGKVAVRFTIGKDGAVSGVSLVKDTTMPDAAVSACVTRAFSSLSFPQPDGGGVVIVTYPLLFSPAENVAAPATKAAPTAPTAPTAPAKPAVAPATSKSP
jgi:hypothetical protein